MTLAAKQTGAKALESALAERRYADCMNMQIEQLQQRATRRGCKLARQHC